MAADEVFKNYVLELLEPLGPVTSRPMFGGYGIFEEGDMFALISGSTLCFKVDDATRAVYEEAGSSQFKSMPYWAVPAEVMEDPDVFAEWARTAIGVGHATAKIKKKGRK